LSLPIVRGPLRGTRWLLASRGKTLRVLLGTYEPEQTELFVRHLRPGGTFLDVGSHVGFYTLLGSRLVGPAGTVWSFEPDPTNAHHLREHARINGAANVRVEEAAVAERAGSARFGGGSGSGTGRLTEAGDRSVRTVALDSFCDDHDLVPTAIKIDVEGAEAAVIEGASATLRQARPVLFVSTHGPEPHERSVALLRDLGYTLTPILGDHVESSSELLALPSEH
jgi:FkbM family methyltransferase